MKKHLPFLDIYYLCWQRTLFILPSHSSVVVSFFVVVIIISHSIGRFGMCVLRSLVFRCCYCCYCCYCCCCCCCRRWCCCCEIDVTCLTFIPDPHPQNDTHFSFFVVSLIFKYINKSMRVWFWAEFLRFSSSTLDIIVCGRFSFLNVICFSFFSVVVHLLFNSLSCFIHFVHLLICARLSIPGHCQAAVAMAGDKRVCAR